MYSLCESLFLLLLIAFLDYLQWFLRYVWSLLKCLAMDLHWHFLLDCHDTCQSLTHLQTHPLDNVINNLPHLQMVHLENIHIKNYVRLLYPLNILRYIGTSFCILLHHKKPCPTRTNFHYFHGMDGIILALDFLP